MRIIQADNLGIKFQLHREKRGTVKGAIAGIFASKYSQSQEFWALRKVSFSVEKGEILGVIGRNGSGKTTLVRVIGGIFSPDEGKIEINGTVSTLLSITAGFQPELSGLENIYLNGILMGFKEREIDRLLDDIIKFSELGKFIEVPVKTYSSGMHARLGFSIAINLKRDIMLIDEVLGVGDTNFHEKCDKKIKDIMQEGRTIVLVSHSMESIKKFSDKVIWLERGIIQAGGKPQNIIEQYLESSPTI